VIVVFGAGGEKDTVKREPMGRAVGARADIAIVTTDNARSEDPASIARALAAGCTQGGRADVKVELDRQRAIELALELAKADDVVVIAGKGHERHQEVDGQKQPFSDVEHVLRAAGRP
jgi:UDP-N-acetylmuramoyl-L-alanyl-D-glutamate--2,6-diaminopimelate ligase